MKLILVLLAYSLVSQGVPAQPLIIGHRGVAGHRPEHTLASYELAIDFGADYVEPDLVMTKDGVLIARHENEISQTTDVSQKFPERKTAKKIDGEEKTGWFTEDFTLQEIKTLRAKERLPFRDHSFDFKYEIPTLKEILDLVSKESKARKKTIGVYPEVKHPSYFSSIHLPLEDALVKELKSHGLDKKSSAVYIQSFEMTALRALKKKISVPLVYLLDEPNKLPYDHVVSGDKRTYGDMTKPSALREIRRTAAGIGPYKRMIIPEVNGALQPATSLVKDAHAVGLKVHPYTFRSDKEFLHSSYGGNSEKEYYQFFDAGVDGVFSDFADDAIKARNTYKPAKK